jgi:DNA-binding winged helix-turn-helix (wHTH) protein/tetratricopeptide (TPR) repeat protein
MAARLLYRFGDFELDAGLGELRRSGASVPIDPKPFALVAYLIQHRDRSVPKEELLRELWPGVAVSDSALASALRDARRALGDDGSAQRILRTERRRGLRFATPLTALPLHPSQNARTLGEDPFLGRDALLAELRGRFAAAERGRGSLILLPGPPGVGKSRLLREFGDVTRAAGGAVATAWCERDEAAPPFRPWSQVLNRLVDGRDVTTLRRTLGQGAVDVARLVPALHEEGEGTLEIALPTEEVRYRLFDAVSTCFAALTTERPALLAIDDLQWADAASLRLLEFLANDLAAQRLLVLAAYRDVAADARPGTERAIEAIAVRSGVERLPVPPLDAEASRALVVVLSGGPDPGAVERIASRCAGIPFLLRELAAAVQRGAVLDTVPDSVRRLVGLNLDALPQRALELLEVAAVRGEHFEPELLAKVHGDDGVMQALEAARGLGLAVREPGERWRFAHALVQECVLDRLDGPRRARLHACVGEALDGLFAGSAEPPLDALARHFHAGRSVAGAGRAIDWGLRAAVEASNALAPERAAEHYRRVLEALEESPTGDPLRRAEALLALAAVQRPNAEAVERAAALARELGDPALLARAALAYVPPGHPSYDTLWLPLCEEALAATPEDEITTRALLTARLAQSFELTHEPDRGARLSLEAVELARRSADDHALGEALSTKIVFNTRQEELERDLAGDVEELLAITERTRRWTSGCFAPAGYYAALGDIAAYERTAERFERWARTWRSPHVQCTVLFLRAWLVGNLGHLEDERRLASEGEALGRRFGVSHTEQFGQAVAFQQQTNRGGKSERLAVADALGAPGAFPWMLCWRARLLAEEGELDEARRLYERLMHDEHAALPRNSSFDACIFDLAITCTELGDKPRAEGLAAELRPFAERGYFRPGTFVGPGGQALGRLLALLGRRSEAENAYRRALAWAARIGSRIGELDTRVDLACLGPAPAISELEQVHQEASALGLRWIAERAARAAAGSPTSAGRLSPAGGRGPASGDRSRTSPPTR